MEIVKINEIDYVKCYGKARGKLWTQIYYPLSGYKAQQPRKNKSAKKIQEDANDDFWSKIVKAKAGNECEYCGTKKGLNSHHIITRSNKRLRWDLDNGICLCQLHHTLSSNFSAHKQPAVFFEWLEREYPGKLINLRIAGNAKGQKSDTRLIWQYLKQKEMELR